MIAETILRMTAIAATTLPVLGCNNDAGNDNRPPRQKNASSQDNIEGYSRVHGAPGPIVGVARFPLLAFGYGVYLLIGRRTKWV